ncbi:MAG: hypothetical protein KZQ93_17115 [Candidatus Thiodiazotropha sp. (ex Monitilora ramsayi)]|nr:hypothetical protein [Candidatus Thiodiazotropha sp. (ex Monitilora ramsayi)]
MKYQNSNKSSGMIRKFPYPFKAMFALCSDLDETPDKETYFAISKYLNTKDKTVMGRGVGLEIGNTIYFEMPKDQFSYWNTDDEGRKNILQLIKSGHIDCIHSYGDYVDSRDKVIEIHNEFEKAGCAPAVWVDHAVAPSNFGADIMCGQGDLEDSPVYHADLTMSLGIKYLWMGRVTSITGQETARKYTDIFETAHPVVSLITMFKEITKVALGRLGSKKYRLHKNNDLAVSAQLRNGLSAMEFVRSNPYWGGVSQAETAYGLKYVLTKKYIERLISKNAYSILYTHLGKIKDKSEPFDKETRESLDVLSEYYQNGDILVATTKRLLDYYMMSNNVQVNMDHNEDNLNIYVSGDYTIDQLDGLTIYVPAKTRKCKMFFNDERIDDISLNDVDESGDKSVSVRWKRLNYPL